MKAQMLMDSILPHLPLSLQQRNEEMFSDALDMVSIIDIRKSSKGMVIS